MDELQRALIEKVAQEQGWERTLSSEAGGVVIASARHQAEAQVSQAQPGMWQVTVPHGQLAAELSRRFSLAGDQQDRFLASSIDELSRLLRRTAELAQSLPRQAERTFALRLQEALAELGPVNTEVERIVKQRVGQDTFREALLDYWGGVCAVTGIALPAILRASHAKPWADCASDAERLDVYNGFLLTANLDALFDRGLITFEDDGQLLISDRLSVELRCALELDEKRKLRWVSERHKTYLHWHREHVFGKG